MTATIPFVEETFAHFNALCFGDVLPPVPVVLVKARTFLGKVEFKMKRDFFGNVIACDIRRMKISVCYDLPQNELEDIVLHEMIHCYILWRNLHDTSAHGRVFRSMAAKINAEYGRNVTVRHSGMTQPERPSRLRCFCISHFRDGNIGITVASPAKVLELRRKLPRRYDIENMEWYSSTDEFFGRYPCSRTPKIYKVDSVELEKRISAAKMIENHFKTGSKF